MEAKLRFVSLAGTGKFTVTELCADFKISRKTGHKWLRRYQQAGPAGLRERSRRPGRCPEQIAARIEQLILRERRRHRTWGPKKLQELLRCTQRIKKLPACSTIARVLRRHGCTQRPRRKPGNQLGSGFVVCRLFQFPRFNHKLQSLTPLAWPKPRRADWPTTDARRASGFDKHRNTACITPMLTLRLPPALDKGLARSARAAKQTKSEFVRAAVLERIAEAEDYRIAVKRLAAVKAGKEKTISFDDLKRSLGL